MEAHLWRLAECGRRMRLDKFSRFEAIVLFNPANIFYFTGSATLFSFLIVTKYAAAGVGLPAGAQSRAKAAATFDHIMTFGSEAEMFASIVNYLEFYKIGKGAIGLEFEYLSRAMTASLEDPGPFSGALELKDCSPLVSGLRAVKEDDELDLIRKAAAAADKGVDAVARNLRPGMTTAELAGIAGEAVMEAGGQRDWHSRLCSQGLPISICSSGWPEGVVETGSLVRVELNPVVGGYHARICRTLCAGEPATGQHDIYEPVLKAISQATLQACEGALIDELENCFAGLAPLTGEEPEFAPFAHGIGIEPAEQPYPAGHEFFCGHASREPLKKNTVLAIGSRQGSNPEGACISDTVLVGASGGEFLTSFPRTPHPA